MDFKSFFKSLLPFLPLLVLYVILISIFSPQELEGDETRHIQYATNITNGYYTDSDNPELGNGPGFPLVIALFVALDTPYIIIRLLNAIFLLAGLLLFYKALVIYISPTKAILISYALGLYTAILKWMVYIHSESLTVFLVCAFLYFFIKLHQQSSKRQLYIVISGLILGLLILTKVIFAYVIVFCLLFYLITFMILKLKKALNSVLVFSIALMLCVPYLFYTYSLTGHIFYWGTQGGELLYWHSTPYPNEYGDWISTDVILGKYTGHSYYDTTEMSHNHRAFIESLEPYSYVKRNELWMEKAVENIKEHPGKYIKNTATSAIRLFFNYPFSYTPQKITTYYYIVPNAFLLLFFLSSILIASIRFPLIPFEIRIIILTVFIYLGGVILLNGRVRHLIPVLPFLLFIIAYVYQQFVRIKIM